MSEISKVKRVVLGAQKKSLKPKGTTVVTKTLDGKLNRRTSEATATNKSTPKTVPLPRKPGPKKILDAQDPSSAANAKKNVKPKRVLKPTPKPVGNIEKLPLLGVEVKPTPTKSVKQSTKVKRVLKKKPELSSLNVKTAKPKNAAAGSMAVKNVRPVNHTVPWSAINQHTGITRQ